MLNNIRPILVVVYFVSCLVIFTRTLSAQGSTTTSAFSPSPSPSPSIAPRNAGINLTLTPISVQLELEPGQSRTTEIKVYNNSTEDESLRVSFGSFTFNDRTQRIDLSQEAPADIAGWISVDRPELVVRPAEWETVKVTFTSPADAALTYYFAVIFNSTDDITTDNTSTRFKGAPAVLVLTSVSSPLAKRELQLESFTVPKLWVEFLPQTFKLKVRNTGNVHLAPIGNIFIDSAHDTDIAVLSANPNKSIILPKTMRELTVSWDDGFPRWLSKKNEDQSTTTEATVSKQELQWDFSQVDRLRIGKYTAHLLLVYDNGERDIPIESYVSFWVIPWRISLAATVVLLCFLLGVKSSLSSLYRSVRGTQKR